MRGRLASCLLAAALAVCLGGCAPTPLDTLDLGAAGSYPFASGDLGFDGPLYPLGLAGAKKNLQEGYADAADAAQATRGLEYYRSEMAAMSAHEAAAATMTEALGGAGAGQVHEGDICGRTCWSCSYPEEMDGAPVYVQDYFFEDGSDVVCLKFWYRTEEYPLAGTGLAIDVPVCALVTIPNGSLEGELASSWSFEAKEDIPGVRAYTWYEDDDVGFDEEYASYAQRFTVDGEERLVSFDGRDCLVVDFKDGGRYFTEVVFDLGEEWLSLSFDLTRDGARSDELYANAVGIIASLHEVRAA